LFSNVYRIYLNNCRRHQTYNKQAFTSNLKQKLYVTFLLYCLTTGKLKGHNCEKMTELSFIVEQTML